MKCMWEKRIIVDIIVGMMGGILMMAFALPSTIIPPSMAWVGICLFLIGMMKMVFDKMEMDFRKMVVLLCRLKAAEDKEDKNET